MVAQAIRDRQRDRVLQAQGFGIFRYAGSEIWANVFKCAQEVIAFLVEDVEHQSESALVRRKQPEKVAAIAKAARSGS